MFEGQSPFPPRYFTSILTVMRTVMESVTCTFSDSFHAYLGLESLLPFTSCALYCQICLYHCCAEQDPPTVRKKSVKHRPFYMNPGE